MPLNKQSGNMYPWITHTWNPIKGKCSHNCKYCYMKRFPQPELHFDRKELGVNLGSGNTIFVGSSCDMFAESVPKEWLYEILGHCEDYLDNTYLFQTKNPLRYQYVNPYDGLNVSWHKRVIIGTTIETNRNYKDFGWEYHVSNAPEPFERFEWLEKTQAYHKMVSIEPIMDFDLNILIAWLKRIKPDFVSIGADSKGHNLPEPSSIKVNDLIKALKQITEVRVKSNLKRLGVMG